MQAALTAVMFDFYASVYYFQQAPWPNLIPYPTFPGSDAMATHSKGVYPVAPVVVSEALIGSGVLARVLLHSLARLQVSRMFQTPQHSRRQFAPCRYGIPAV